jgi:hypothetical protein
VLVRRRPVCASKKECDAAMYFLLPCFNVHPESASPLNQCPLVLKSKLGMEASCIPPQP